ncbi:MAG: periplasmic heavy metal sensor [Gammaproteobacteria bacterium]|nr:MAG: periplasmic heavy metal sensor [Gammaproteobacteria bacterium]
MTTNRSLITRLLLASAVALAIPLAAQARGPGGDCCDHAMHGGPGMQCMDRSEGDQLPPMLHRLDLSDAQRDQVRELMRSQSETMRARAEAHRKTHDELRQLPMSEDYSEAKLKALAEASGKAAAEMAELRARTARQLHQLLTPEQRQQLGKMSEQRTEWREERMERRKERMERRAPAAAAPEGGR